MWDSPKKSKAGGEGFDLSRSECHCRPITKTVPFRTTITCMTFHIAESVVASGFNSFPVLKGSVLVVNWSLKSFIFNTTLSLRFSEKLEHFEFI